VVRVLGAGDADAALAVLERDPLANVFVASRVQAVGLNAGKLGAEVWAHPARGPVEALCYAGANLVPVAADGEALHAFADRARRRGRRCSSIVGPAAMVEPLWDLLRPAWGEAREVRRRQPLLAISEPPRAGRLDGVRRVRPDELEKLLPASVAMFTEEVGVSPLSGDGGAMYRSRVAELVQHGRAFALFDGDRVRFKAEIGAVSTRACQLQGVWVDPAERGRGLGAAGTAAVVAEALATLAPVVTLYVNDFNSGARAAYDRVGFTEVGRFASVLF
jgi:predicted GNAT family acetyltransferase